MRLEDTVTDILSEAVVESEEDKPKFVRNVALSGIKSKNGYEYAEKAYENAINLYEGASVFIDHQMSKLRERSVRDLVGHVQNPRWNNINKRMMGDISVLDTDSGRFFMELARVHPPNVCMSQVISGKRNRSRTIVESIQEVLSVDVVTGGATTTNFSEQETDMSDMSDKAVEVLQEQNKDLQTKIETASQSHQNEIKEMAVKLNDKSEEFDTLKESHTKLEETLKETQVKLDEFEVQATLSERAKTIQEELEKAELTDETLLTETFMKQLQEKETPEERALLIEDRKAIMEKVSSGPFITERQSTSKAFDPKEFAKNNNIYV